MVSSTLVTFPNKEGRDTLVEGRGMRALSPPTGGWFVEGVDGNKLTRPTRPGDERATAHQHLFAVKRASKADALGFARRLLLVDTGTGSGVF